MLLRETSRRPWVLWVEEEHKKTLRNKFSIGLIQSSDWSNGTSRYLWDHGLTGEGEIIGARCRPGPTEAAIPPPHTRRSAGSLPRY